MVFWHSKDGSIEHSEGNKRRTRLKKKLEYIIIEWGGLYQLNQASLNQDKVERD